MVLVLSGSAFAADGGVGTTSQPTGSSVSQTGESSTIDQSSTGSVSVAVINNTGQGGDQSNPSGGAPAALGTDTGALGTTQLPSAPGVPSLTTADVSLPTPVQSNVAGNPAGPASSSIDFGAAEVPAVDSGTASGAGGLTQVAAMSQAVVFHSARLTIRPQITPMNSQTYDLAAMVPSAPAQQQNPSNPPKPTTPNGFFGDLTAILALTVVPSIFTSSNLNLLGLAIEISILAAILYLAIPRAVMAIGSWTRRGGYAHAARSDVPAVSATYTFFATPFRLGYVSAFAPPHSPFLMVSDMKTVLSMVPNAFRKEEMR